MLVKVEALTKHYPVPRKKLLEEKQLVKAVDGISFAIREGETFGLVGESGCGKSTTGQMMVKLLEESSGHIHYNGVDLTHVSKGRMKALRKELQIVFQDPYASLNPKKNIGWLLEEPLIIHKIGDKQSRQRLITQVLEQVGLDSAHLRRYPHELSGGQRQRIGIATALVLDPKFMVIDEAVSALDVSVQAQILNLLKELQRQRGLTYLFISHDLNVVQYMSDRVGVMYLGKIVEIFDVDAEGGKPVHPYTQALFSAVPGISATRDKRIVLSGDVPSPLHPPSGCAFHPRCPYAMERCKQDTPELAAFTHNHQVSCHLYDNGALTHLSQTSQMGGY